MTPLWDEREQDRCTGKISFEDCISYVLDKCGKKHDNALVDHILSKRMSAKSICFEDIHPDVLRLLSRLMESGYKTAIISNCSPEEAAALKKSSLYRYFDEVILSYEAHRMKPDPRIYAYAARRLGIVPGECLFVGDGGSNELAGAKAAGMDAVQTKWYTNLHAKKRETFAVFPSAENPMDIVKFILGK